MCYWYCLWRTCSTGEWVSLIITFAVFLGLFIAVLALTRRDH